MKDNRREKPREPATGDGISIFTLPEKLKKSPNDILNAIQSLERRTFPSSECLAILAETSKRNTQLLYAQSSSGIVGYLVFIHTPGGLRIHKVCIAEAFRRRRIATSLIEKVCDIASKAGKDIDLWVDEARIPARECYIKCGFAHVGETVIDYYGPGRNGIRMVWKCE
jgi:ribosomal protein S18 acetylase RimI-like enzyme